MNAETAENLIGEGLCNALSRRNVAIRDVDWNAEVWYAHGSLSIMTWYGATHLSDATNFFELRLPFFAHLYDEISSEGRGIDSNVNAMAESVEFLIDNFRSTDEAVSLDGLDLLGLAICRAAELCVESTPLNLAECLARCHAALSACLHLADELRGTGLPHEN